MASVSTSEPFRADSRADLPTGHQPGRRYAAVVIAATLIRVAVLCRIGSAPFASDARDYTELARSIASGSSFVPYWPPGVALYLAPFIALGAPAIVLRGSILIFWLIACWAFYRLMRALGRSREAWMVLAVFTCLPDSIQMSLEPMTQMPIAALVLVALSAAVNVIRGAGAKEQLLLGASLGVAGLTRPSSIPLLFLLPAASAAVSRRFAPALAGVLLGVTIIGCWVAHVHSMTGKWLINTANASNLYYGNNPWTPTYKTWYFGSHAKLGSTEIDRFTEYRMVLERISTLPQLEQPRAFQTLTSEYVRAHPGMFAYRTFNRIRCFFGFDTFTGSALAEYHGSGIPWSRIALLLEAATYLLLSGWSVFWIARAPSSFWRDPIAWTILGTMVVYAAPYWISMSHPTYHFPLLLPLAALGAVAWGACDRQQKAPLRAWVACGVLLAIQVEWVLRMKGGTA